MKGIDVSENNGSVDWQAVVDAGIEFAMVRISYGKHGVDESFAENVQAAQAAGLKVGGYHYSYALSVDDAVEEAQNCLDAIHEAGVTLDLPLFFDMEDADGYKARHEFVFDPDEITDICRTFIANFGGDCGVYASLSWLENYIDWQSLGCPVWNAQWGDSDSIKGYLWQYTDKLVISDKEFDGNILY